MRLLAALLLLALPAAAQETPSDPLTAEEFEAIVQGRTLTYGVLGQPPYGAERYMAGRRVIWTFLDGTCQEGSWYPEGEAICFDYDNAETPVCWQIYQGDDGLIATVTDGSAVLYQIGETTEGFVCGGLGV